MSFGPGDGGMDGYKRWLAENRARWERWYLSLGCTAFKASSIAWRRQRTECRK